MLLVIELCCSRKATYPQLIEGFFTKEEVDFLEGNDKSNGDLDNVKYTKKNSGKDFSESLVGAEGLESFFTKYFL